MSKNKVIRATDSDALLTKFSAEKAGYFKDDLLKFFLSPKLDPQDVRKLPLINRGTYVRVSALSRLIEAFLFNDRGVNQRKQIISLGAGSDTRPFHYVPRLGPDVVYHEIDFIGTARDKASTIYRTPELNTALSVTNVGGTMSSGISYNIPETQTPGAAPQASGKDISKSRLFPLRSDNGRTSSNICNKSAETAIMSDSYTLHGLDLRSLITPEAVLALSNIDKNLPTLILSECCLCYLEPDLSDDIIKSFVSAFKDAPALGIISYEPFGNDDQFGRVMVQNLAARGISIPALMAYPTLQSQITRLKRLGFNNASAADVLFIHDKWNDVKELQRLDSLELLDEREEFDLLAKHYGVYWASISSDESIFSSWDSISYQLRF
ncbi:S-adenosyl-L-methionine-dependent methyltransferase [Dipodascopsis uninucleata]